MKKLIKQNIYFLVPYVIFLCICGFLILTFSKTELHILSNKANSPFFDIFFKYITNLGDGAIIAILTITLLTKNAKTSLTFLSGSLLTAVVINLFKKVILNDVYRPSKYFELYENYQLHFVEGVKLNVLQSFPSGHTGTAFNVFFMLALLTKNKFLKLLCFLLAATVAYSRVYLSQHFLIDITVGSLFGVLFIFLFTYWFNLSEKKWLNWSVFSKK